jgi:hypothetical protein
LIFDSNGFRVRQLIAVVAASVIARGGRPTVV